jgi:large subunit ribosomal protein L15e
MVLNKYLKKTNRSKEVKDLMKQRKVVWRKEPATIRVDRPTKLDRARSLGYKAKQGFLVVRQRLKRGGRMREKPAGGRRSAHSGRTKIVDKNYKRVAEERVSRKYPNCEVLNSYYVTKDGLYMWYEIILVDACHPRVLYDKNTTHVFFSKGRAFRGLTSSGRKSRGLRKKGKGSEKTRSSKS